VDGRQQIRGQLDAVGLRGLLLIIPAALDEDRDVEAAQVLEEGAAALAEYLELGRCDLALGGAVERESREQRRHLRQELVAPLLRQRALDVLEAAAVGGLEGRQEGPAQLAADAGFVEELLGFLQRGVAASFQREQRAATQGTEPLRERRALVTG